MLARTTKKLYVRNEHGMIDEEACEVERNTLVVVLEKTPRLTYGGGSLLIVKAITPDGRVVWLNYSCLELILC